jgi:hypothetical protein
VLANIKERLWFHWGKKMEFHWYFIKNISYYFLVNLFEWTKE